MIKRYFSKVLCLFSLVLCIAQASAGAAPTSDDDLQKALNSIQGLAKALPSTLDFQRSDDLNDTTVCTMHPGIRRDTVQALSPQTQTAIEVDWFTGTIDELFERGSIVTVTDVETGISWQEQRSGGSNHADVQPVTEADTEKLKSVYGGTWAWDRRAIWVTIDGIRYAASMNGMPHGSGSIPDNGFNGHHCIHFTNSRTHGSNSVDENHQRMVAYAASAA